MSSSKDYIQTLTIVHSICSLVLVFALVASIMEVTPSRIDKIDLYFMLGLGVAFFGGIAFSYKMSLKYINIGKGKRGIREKLLSYRKALYIQWATIGILSLLTNLIFIQTSGKQFVFANIFFIVLFIFFRPTISKTITDLDLDEGESRILRTPDAAL